jgi:CheY-like chemotaxis protein
MDGLGTLPMPSTLLVVDDNAISREGMAVVLRNEGYSVVVFPGAKEALSYLRDNPHPDLILLDMIMPPSEGDGWHFLANREQVPGLASLPIIIIPAISIACDEWAISLGACGVLKKPVEVEPLLAEIRRCLKS